MRSIGQTTISQMNERCDPSDRNQQRSPFSTPSNTSCGGATSESLLSRSSDEEDQIDQRDERY